MVAPPMSDGSAAPLSEDRILACLAGYFPQTHPSLLLGRGDDCAVLKAERPLCVSSDLFLEDIHFRRSYFTPEDTGYKALAVNVSDLAGCGARPLGFTLCLGLPAWVDMEWLNRFFSGMAEVAGQHRMALAGGDLSRSKSLHISITVWGETADPGHFLVRGGSMPGDVLFVVGPLGLARVGLAQLEAQGRQALEAWPAACAAHLRPAPQVDAGLMLARAGYNARPPALMDLSDGIMRELEARAQPYLFKLRLSKNVKRHIERLFRVSGWCDAGQGWEGIDSTLALTGWEDKRRVVVLRRALKGEMLVAQEDNGQQLLGFIEADRKGAKRITGYEYAVLVTNLDHEILSLGQLYRDRADAENAFDELKNQWGWGGFTTHDLHRCQLSARAVALIYNWWSLFVRLASPAARREATTSRPWLMSSVERRTEHAGQTTITLTGLHALFGKARQVLMRISSQLQTWVAEAAEPLNIKSVWQLCCDHLKHTLAAIGPPPTLRLLPDHANGVK